MRSVLSSGISLISGFFAPATRAARQAELATAFRFHAGFVYRVLRRLGVDAHAADDMVQEVFIVALRKWARYDPDAPLRPWLYGIARRVASHYRRARRRIRGRDQAARSLGGPGLGRSMVAGPSPEEHVEAREASEFIQAFCEGLSPALRDVFVCVELEGMSGPEASDALGLKLNTVYTRLRRARLALHKAVESRSEGSR